MTPEQKEKNSIRHKKMYESRKAAGICVYCGKKPAVSGKVACVMCAKWDAKRHMEKNRKMGMLPRCLFGDGYHCVICGRILITAKSSVINAIVTLCMLWRLREQTFKEDGKIKILYLEAGKRRHSGMNCGEDCPSNEKDRNSLPCCNCERRNAIVKKEEEERKRMKENVKLRNRKAKMGDIQDIQKEIEIIKNEMTDLKKMLQEKPSSQDSLQKEAATKQEQTESEFWMPGYGEPFFAVDAVYGVTECIFEEGDDLDYMMVGNCFATAERAEQVSKKLEFLFRLEQLHDQFCPEFEPDWNDHDTPKIAVHFDCEKDKMVSTCTYSEKSVYEVYFDSFETADKVAAILNREVVK